MLTIFRSDSEWTLARLGKSYQVNFVQTGTQFTGHYLGIDNPSTFSGEILTGRGRTLVHFVQSTKSNEYYAVHAGKLIRSDCIEGHWYDTAGNAGQFSLKSQPNLTEAIDNARERAIASREPNNRNPGNLDDSNGADPDPSIPTAGVISAEDVQRQGRLY